MSPVNKRPTLADVAALAGASTAVVSYVVNNGPRAVSPETRLRVESAIEQLGYRRNSLAGALSAGRSNLVGLLVPDSSNAFFGELARRVEGEGRKRGLLTLLGNAGYNAGAEKEYLAAFSDLRPRGILVASIVGGRELPIDCPRVFLHSAPEHPTGPSVVFDDHGGAGLAVGHLLSHGKLDIHCISGLTAFGPAGKREAGWADCLEASGLPSTDRLHRVSFDRIKAEHALLELFSRDDRPDAIFATTDELGLAALRAATIVGLRVPEDVAIVGFDGIREALYGSVRLTTVSVPLEQLAVEAFDALEALDRGQDDADRPAVQTVLTGELRIGETCGCELTSV